jgi:urease accessory protein
MLEEDDVSAVNTKLKPHNSSEQKWLASLDMTFARRANKTVLSGSKRQGPLAIQRAFYPDLTGCPHIYLLHPPAGIVSGDILNISACLHPNSHVLMTTPGAARFYRARVDTSSSLFQTQTLTFNINDGASLEYLPMETLIYNKANAVNCVEVHLQGDGQYIGWEISCLGLPHIGQAFVSGDVNQSITLFHNKKCLFHDLMSIMGGDAMMHQKVALGGRHVVGNMILFDGAAEAKTAHLGLDITFVEHLIARCREVIIGMELNALAAVTELQNVIVVRYLGDCSEQCRKIFSAIWQEIRPIMLNIQGIAPRIWHT